MTIPPTQKAWSVRMTDSVIARDPIFDGWSYVTGLMLKACALVWEKTKDPVYYDHVITNYDRSVNDNGSINQYYVFDEYQLDHVAPGKLLFMLYRTTGKEKYKKAADLLMLQLEKQPRTKEGGFWHKRIHPYQMWVDGVFMACPYLAEYAHTFNVPGAFDEAAKQIILMTRYTRDPKTGLLYHGWEETRTEVWANPKTGQSPYFWSRGLGWYTMGIADVLDFLPKDHPQRPEIIRIFQDVMAAVAKVQDPETGLWYQILDQGGREGNYLEASGSCMYVYSMIKGARMGYLDAHYADLAHKAYAGILEKFVSEDEHGLLNLNQICLVAAFDNGSDGSYEYYISRPIVSNDYKGVGPFVMASIEIEK